MTNHNKIIREFENPQQLQL